MRRTTILWAACAAAGVVVVTAARGQAPAPADGAGWTGVDHAADIIVARKALMAEIDRFMPGIDYFAAGQPGNLEELKAAAASIGGLLLALPHLFPPTTNIYAEEAAAEYRTTVALPTIWQDFGAFYAMATATSSLARDAAMAETEADFRTLGGALRASCDGCHAAFMQAYVPPPLMAPVDIPFPFGP